MIRNTHEVTLTWANLGVIQHKTGIHRGELEWVLLQAEDNGETAVVTIHSTVSRR